MLRWMVLAALLASSSVGAQESCETGVVFGFFNGVQTTEAQAKDAVFHHLRKLYGPTTPNDQPITYELFYNDTQGFADFVETFEQRLQEQNGLLAGRFELFFSATKGEGSWWDALINAIPALGDLLKSLFDTFLAKLFRELTAQFGNPSMAEVSARHRAQIDHWASLNQKMLLLAHSQGNLFVNKAYTHAVGKSGAEYVRVVHVAPASPGLSGRHTLADKDIVINGLRLTGTVAPNTDEILPYADRPPGLNGSRDLIGHGLLEIYLNPALSTAGRIRGDVLTALHDLDSAPRKPMPPYPDFVYREWEGGDAPRPVYAPSEASHHLQRVVMRDTFAVPWMFSSIHGWRNALNSLPYSPRPELTRTSTHFIGEAMAGNIECTWGISLEGAGDGLSHECTYEKVPVKEYEIYRQLRVPDELSGLGSVPDGTVVHLNEMTFSQVNVSRSVSDIDTPLASMEFYSGFQSRWASEIEDKRTWSEPYWFRRGALLNEEALLAHSEALRRHEMAEYLRAQQHALLRWEYEQRRQACGPLT